ncbi:MAG: hypothetical protein JXX14_20660 [Deltaproteobacteria bacterium]|nr:hypothetical protein [Deltaproteobacteria bacterium]
MTALRISILSAAIILGYALPGRCASADASVAGPDDFGPDDVGPDDVGDDVAGDDVAGDDVAGDDTDSAMAPEIDDAGQPSEITAYVPGEAPLPADVLSEDPLDADETSATMAVIGVSQTETDAAMGSSEEMDAAVANLLEQLKPYGKGDMELAVGLGGARVGYGDGFMLTVSAVFAYYVFNRLAPGLEMDYVAVFGEVKYPQSLTLFPFVKFVPVRSSRFAPYLLLGGGRTMEWGGAERPVNTTTGEINGFLAVSSWVTGMGGGVMIGIGSRAHLQLQLLAMHRAYDENIWREINVARVVERDAAGNPVVTFEAVGERTDSLWYPSPSIWFSFSL